MDYMYVIKQGLEIIRKRCLPRGFWCQNSNIRTGTRDSKIQYGEDVDLLRSPDRSVKFVLYFQTSFS